VSRRALLVAAGLFSYAAAHAQSSDCQLLPAPAGLARTGAPHAASGDDITLSVAAVYTPEAADSAIARGQPIETWIANAFAAWQLVLDSAASSGPRIVAEARGVQEFDFEETGACQAELDAFRADPRSAQLRDSLEANLVILFTARCNAAYLCEDINTCEPSAYASVRFAVTGLPNAEGGHALAHEAGHLIGMRHDIVADPTPGYNHGYRDEAGGFFTVMSFRGPLPRTDMVSAYSDPLRTFEGRPLGTFDTADNARVLRENAPIAATWNQGTPVEPGPEDQAVHLSAYPNPARGSWLVDVRVPGALPVHLALYDAAGRRVWAAEAESGQTEMRASGLGPGVYLLRATVAGTGSTPSASIRLTIAR
jgi:hypothetical protein